MRLTKHGVHKIDLVNEKWQNAHNKLNDSLYYDCIDFGQQDFVNGVVVPMKLAEEIIAFIYSVKCCSNDFEMTNDENKMFKEFKARYYLARANESGE